MAQMTASNQEARKTVRADLPANGRAGGSVSLMRRARRFFYHRVMRFLTLVHQLVVFLGKRIGPRPHLPADGEGFEILLTGRFFSSNWPVPHLRPLAASRHCSRVVVVSSYPVPDIAKVITIYPPSWLTRIVGSAPARLLVFALTAFRRRPHIVGGFHMKVNALAATALAPWVGARALYFCVGGRTEVLDGGIWGEAKFFERMETPDALVERRLLQAADACDVIITMGTGAAAFLRGKGVAAPIHVVPGGMDKEQFLPTAGVASIDLILVGRLSDVKGIDLFLHTVRRVANTMPNIKAVVVGDGPLRSDLEQLARDLGIDCCVRFVGFQPQVSDWLRKSKVFMLTSRSEGLSLALMEAMMCGLPAVVPNVGDLGDLVEDGVNGYLVSERSAEAFAAPVLWLLADDRKYAAFSRAARCVAMRYEMAEVTLMWDGILAKLSGGGGRAASG
ncbi:MAG: glycosyltransferase family 4 protein [Planctomycetota bacterium]|nr:glycosyltransferase family 4 protein [Planctomycetota bacterium]